MKAKIRHNKEIITLEKEGCAKDEIFTSAFEKINLFYKDHINEIQIENEIYKFIVKIELV